MIRKTAILWALLLCLLATGVAGADGSFPIQPLFSRCGDRGPDIRLLPAELARLGCDQGESDGSYDARTVNAIEQYLKGRGLPREPAVEETRSMPWESGPGERGSHVRRLQQALTSLRYLPSGAADGVFSEATLRAVIAFQNDKGLCETGRADRDTLQVMFRKPRNVPGTTQMPYWYDGGSDLIPVGAVFEVMDIRSGIRFTCRRLCGVSHLDAETLTVYDTLAMKEAYGGEWSWNRRPVLLNYRGNVYAASMNGMPHSWQSIPGNRMDGHFCIHFFGSRIDTSQRVDAAHLQCVFEASFAGWDDGAD